MKPGWTNRVTGSLLVVLGALIFLSGAGTILTPPKMSFILWNTVLWGAIGGSVIALGLWIALPGRKKP